MANKLKEDVNSFDARQKKEEKETVKAEFGALTSRRGFIILRINLFVLTCLVVLFTYYMISGYEQTKNPTIFSVLLQPVYYFFLDFLVLCILVWLGKKYVNRWFLHAAFHWYQYFIFLIPVMFGVFLFDEKLEQCQNYLKAYKIKHVNTTQRVVDDDATGVCSLRIISFGFVCILALLRLTVVLKQRAQMVWDVTLLSLVILCEGGADFYVISIIKTECNCWDPIRVPFAITIINLVFGFFLLLIGGYFWLLRFDSAHIANWIVNEDYEHYEKLWASRKPKETESEFLEFRHLDANCCTILGYGKKVKKVLKLKRKTTQFNGFFRSLHQPVSELDVLLTHAEYVQEWFNKVLYRMHQQLSGSCKCTEPVVNGQEVIRCDVCKGLIFKESKPKSRKRALEKILRSYRGRNDAVIDYVRGSIVCEDFSDISKLLQLLYGSKQKKNTDSSTMSEVLLVEQITNRFRPENDTAKVTAGYRDIQLKVRTVGFEFDVDVDPKIAKLLQDPINKMKQHIAELQIHLPEFYKVKYLRNMKEDRNRGLQLQELLLDDGYEFEGSVSVRSTSDTFDLRASLNDAKIVHGALRKINSSKAEKAAAHHRLNMLNGHQKYKLRRYLLDE
eukprot:m.345627 g.345627  ORF g.345627 m.345627 type:complete len:616 (-) comp26935_c0_seq1:161-2008(-)